MIINALIRASWFVEIYMSAVDIVTVVNMEM